MSNESGLKSAWRRLKGTATAFLLAPLFGSVLLGGCTRLPYTTQTIHQDKRVAVILQREITPIRYSHPFQLGAEEVEALLAGFSFREKQRLPLPWYAEESPPRRIFRTDEAQALAPFLVEALQKAVPDERVYFQVLAPGTNPANERDVTGGWIAVRDPYFHLGLEHFHAQFPVRGQEQWDLRYPAIPPAPSSYLLYFEPGRFWVTDPNTGTRAIEFQGFLKSESGPKLK